MLESYRSYTSYTSYIMARTFKDQRKYQQKQKIRSGFVDVSYETENLKDYKNLKSILSLMDSVTD